MGGKQKPVRRIKSLLVAAVGPRLDVGRTQNFRDVATSHSALISPSPNERTAEITHTQARIDQGFARRFASDRGIRANPAYIGADIIVRGITETAHGGDDLLVGYCNPQRRLEER